MAIILPGVGFGEARGSVGAVTYSRNRGGAYMKSRTSPVNPPSVYSEEVRSTLSYLSKIWQGLTPSQQAAWAAAASETTILNRFSLPIAVTGEQLFIRVNQRPRLYQSSVISDPPTDWTVNPELPITLVIDSTPGMGLPKIQLVPGTPGASDGLYIRMTPPMMSLGVKNFRKYLRTMGIFTDITAAPSDLDAAYQARFGDIDSSTVGKRVYLELSGYSDSNGLISPPVQIAALIT